MSVKLKCHEGEKKMVRKNKSAQDMIDEEDDEAVVDDEESDDEEEEEKPVKDKKEEKVLEVPIDLTLINNKINYILSILDKK